MVARDEEVHPKREVAKSGEGEGEGRGEGEYATQPCPYWPGRAFFDASGAGRAAEGCANWV